MLTDPKPPRTLERVSYVILIMMAGLEAAVLYKWLFNPSDADQNLLIMVTQAVISMCTGVAGYFLGSSDSSRKKDAVIAASKEKENA